MAKSVVEAYNAYPLNDVNKYNVDINSKRLGFQQGYEKATTDTVNAVIQFLRNDSRAKYMLEYNWEILEDIRNAIEKSNL